MCKTLKRIVRVNQAIINKISNFHEIPLNFTYSQKNCIFKSSGASHSDGKSISGRIHSDVSSNIPKKVYHLVTDNFVNLLHIS